MAFTGADILTLIRQLTGRQSTTQVTDDNLLAKLNWYYRYRFPE